MDKSSVIVNLGNIIMRSTPTELNKDDKLVIFDAYKLLSEYYYNELEANADSERSGWDQFAEVVKKRKKDAAYLKWRDDYVDQITWFYKYLGLGDAHAVGDFLYFGSNDVCGYNLRTLYQELKKEDELGEEYICDER